MSEYYAVQRSTDHLAHYGVKGMKWGVRKALAKDSYKKTDKALSRQYKKAQKHLQKLKIKADVQKQEAKAKIQGRKAIRSGIGTLGLTGIHGLVSSDKLNKALNFPTMKITAHGNLSTQKFSYGGKLKDLSSYDTSKLYPNKFTEIAVKGGTGLISGAALAKTAYHTGKAIAAKHRTTDKGHAKAVAKMNSWKNAMDDVFAGTKYSKKKYKQKRG